MSTPPDPTDDQGRYVWVVTWGRPGRVDWKAVLVKAYDAEEARHAARDAYPDRFPPEGVVLAAPATARSVLEGRPDATAKNLPLIG